MAVDFTFAVKLVFVPLARRQLRLADFRIGWRDADLFSVEVISVFDLPVKAEIVLVLLEVEDKRLISRNKV
ncbi:hypothetical protein D3C78_1174330 [compost metagenome]